MEIWASTAAASGSLSDPEALLLRAVVVQARADARRVHGDAVAFLEALGAPERLRLPPPADWPVRLVTLVHRQVPLRAGLRLLGVSWSQYKAWCVADPELRGRLSAARRAYHRSAPAPAELHAYAFGE